MKNFPHFIVASTEDLGSGDTFSMAAEVGLLTRNVKIVGEDTLQMYAEAFGARVLVGTYSYEDFVFTGMKKVYIFLRFCEIYRPEQ